MPRKRARLTPGGYFGEMSLLDGGARSATVVAETPMRLLVIKRRDFSTLLREAPELTQSILATLSRRVRQAEQALGSKPRVGHWGFSTNGIATCGIFGVPTIGFGPGDEIYAHTPDDQCPVDHLTTAARFYAAFPQAFLRTR